MGSEWNNLLSEDSDSWWVDRMYLQDAWSAARHSTDPSTQVGTALVAPTGHGVVMKGWNCIHDRLRSRGYPKADISKNYCTEHAERKVIYRTIENGLPIQGFIMYCTWACCAECARTILEFDISKVVTLSRLVEATPERWSESVRNGLTMLRDCGIKVVGWKGDLGVDEMIRFNGKYIGKDALL